MKLQTIVIKFHILRQIMIRKLTYIFKGKSIKNIDYFDFKGKVGIGLNKLLNKLFCN